MSEAAALRLLRPLRVDSRGGRGRIAEQASRPRTTPNRDRRHRTGTIGNVSEARYFVRVLAAADIHGALNVYEWLVELAKEHAELVVLAGDLFAGDWEEGQRRQAQQIIAMLKRAGVPCFYIMGNDDNVSLEHEDEQIKPLHGRRLYCGIQGFVGYQFTPPFVGNAFAKPESEIEKDLQSLEPLLYERAVLVTHAPAYGALDQSFGGEHVGSRSLAALLDRTPVLAHIHGHIHGSFGRDGDHFNVASAGQRRAIVIDLPSLNHEILSAD
jgi:Icc-related predicted phosphoesterase